MFVCLAKELRLHFYLDFSKDLALLIRSSLPLCLPPSLTAMAVAGPPLPLIGISPFRHLPTDRPTDRWEKGMKGGRREEGRKASSKAVCSTPPPRGDFSPLPAVVLFRA